MRVKRGGWTKRWTLALTTTWSKQRMIRPLKQAAGDLAETALVGGVAGREKLVGRERVVVSMSKSMAKSAHVC